MTRTQILKLVRNNIPQQIKDSGKNPTTYVLDDVEYAIGLRKIINSSLNNFMKDHNTNDLLDLLEALFSLAQEQGINREELLALMEEKNKKDGSYDNRLLLEYIND